MEHIPESDKRETFRQAVENCLVEDYALDSRIAQVLTFTSVQYIDQAYEDSTLVEEAADKLHSDPQYWTHVNAMTKG